MKKISFLAAVAAAMMLTACGGKTPSSTTGSSSSNKSYEADSDYVNDRHYNDSYPDDEMKPLPIEEETLNVEDVTLPQLLKGNMEVVKAVKTVDPYECPQMIVTLRLIEPLEPMIIEDANLNIVGVSLDEDGAPVEGMMWNNKPWDLKYGDDEDFFNFLLDEPGSVVNIKFSCHLVDPDVNLRRELAKVKKFQIKQAK